MISGLEIGWPSPVGLTLRYASHSQLVVKLHHGHSKGIATVTGNFGREENMPWASVLTDAHLNSVEALVTSI